MGTQTNTVYEMKQPVTYEDLLSIVSPLVIDQQSDELSIHKADISAMLHTMCKKHLLISEGHGKGTIYHLPNATLEPSSVTLSTNIATSGANIATSMPKRTFLEQRQQMILEYCSDGGL